MVDPRIYMYKYKQNTYIHALTDATKRDDVLEMYNYESRNMVVMKNWVNVVSIEIGVC